MVLWPLIFYGNILFDMKETFGQKAKRYTVNGASWGTILVLWVAASTYSDGNEKQAETDNSVAGAASFDLEQ